VFARVHTLEATPEQQREGLRVLQDEVLPWLRESTGFRGIVRLTDPERDRTITLTLWATEDDLRESADAAARIGELTASGIGATLLSTEEYEVTLLELER
jgi:heme-degrading monooxygenase HmoA